MKHRIGKGIIAAMAALLALCSSPKRESLAEKSDSLELMDAEAAIAGAAMTMDRYLNSDFALDPEQLLKLVLGDEEETTEETTEEDDSSLPEETATVPEDETIPENSQESKPEQPTTVETVPPTTVPEAEPETVPPTTVPVVPGYTGLAICKADNYVNVRSHPGTYGALVGKIPSLAVAQVVEEVPTEDGSWYRITSGNVIGYVKSTYFYIGAEADQLYWQVASRIGTVNAVNLRLRSTPDASHNSNVMTTLAFGTKVVIVGEEGDFYRIGLDEGYYGYLHKQYVDVTVQYKQAYTLEEERLAAQAAEAARKEAERLAAEAEAMRLEAERQAAEASRQAAEASRLAAEAEASRLAAEAQASRAAAETPAKITLRYVGPQKYAGNVLNPQDLEITVHFLDGHYVKNLPGWGCAQVGQALPEGDVKIIVGYANLSAGMTIHVLPSANQPAEPVTQAPPQTEAPQPVTQAPPQTEAPQPTQPVTQAPPAPQPQPPLSAYDELRQAIVAFALQFEGNPYVYGGSDLLHGTDCSGFTSQVYKHFNINITRTSRSQAVAGRQVSLENIRPGDLLFYDTNGTITHVALYIGNGQIIHAANKELGILIMDAFYRMPCKAVTFLDTP